MSYQLYPKKIFLPLLLGLTLISCVTINIYFPAAAAEKVAEQIVDDVLQSDTKSQQPDSKQSDNEQGQINQQNYYKQKSIIALIDFFIPGICPAPGFRGEPTAGFPGDFSIDEHRFID